MTEWLDGQIEGFTRQAWNRDAGGWARKPAIILLHSTEGGSWPTYAAASGAGANNPHFTVSPRARQTRQHVPLTRAARALVSGPGNGRNTNTGGAIQIEIIGTCDPRMGGVPSVLTFDDGDLAYLATVLHAISAATGIPLTTSVEWLSYPASYGASRVRLGWNAWGSYHGVLGHQHCPANVHGDPGSLNVARLLVLAGGAGTIPVGSHTGVPVPVHVPAPAPAPADTRRRNRDGSLTIAEDGDRGSATISRWEEVEGTTIDGVISHPKSACILADQKFLNSVVPANNIRDLTGKDALVEDGDEGPRTIAVRQFWLYNRWARAVLHRPARADDFDSVNGPETNQLHQHALNAATARSRRY